MFKYDYLKEEQKLAIWFDKHSRKELSSLFGLINSSIGQKKYFIVIDGLEVTIDEYLKSCQSENYRIYDNGRYNKFIKNLPTLCLLSDYWDDVIKFEDSIGAFSEGCMSISFIDLHFYAVLKDNSDKNKLITDSQSHCFLRIDVLSGSDVIEIVVGELDYNIENILDWLSSHNAIDLL